MIEWLEDFKAKLGEYKEAQPTIQEVEGALQSYKELTDKIRIPWAIEKAREARSKDGSVLEYGLTWHLERFVDAVDPHKISFNRFS